jgi:hypothetical protein
MNSITLGGSDVTGFFKVNVQRSIANGAWMFGGGAALIALGVVGIAWGARHPGELGAGAGIILCLSVLLGIPLAVRGLIRLRRKPGVYLHGLRMTSDGFEVGDITAPLAAIELMQGSHLARSGLAGSAWKPASSILGDCSLTLALRPAQSVWQRNHYFFDAVLLTTKGELRCGLASAKSRNYMSSHDLGTIQNGNFELLGTRGVVHYSAILPLLERAADVAASSGHVTSCILHILGPSSGSGSGFPAYGAVGALAGSVVDGLGAKRQRAKWAKGKLFDPAFSERLMDFAQRRGWRIAVG